MYKINIIWFKNFISVGVCLVRICMLRNMLTKQQRLPDISLITLWMWYQCEYNTNTKSKSFCWRFLHFFLLFTSFQSPFVVMLSVARKWIFVTWFLDCAAANEIRNEITEIWNEITEIWTYARWNERRKELNEFQKKKKQHHIHKPKSNPTHKETHLFTILLSVFFSLLLWKEVEEVNAFKWNLILVSPILCHGCFSFFLNGKIKLLNWHY